MDYQSEVGQFFEKLRIWREESQHEFSNIMQFHSSSINKGVNNMVVELSDLKTKLYVITQERNDLLQTVHNLSNDIRQRNAEFPNPQPLPEPEEIHTNDTEDLLRPRPDIDKNEGHIHSSETDDEVDPTFNKFGDLVNVECVARDEEMINEKLMYGNGKQEEAEQMNKKKEISVAVTPTTNESIGYNYESNCSKTIDNVNDYVCPECNFAFSTRENLGIHLKNLHPKLEQINIRKSLQEEGDKIH